VESNEIKDLIKEAKINKANLLDLSSKKITYLPSEISELKSLNVLYISDNQLTSLPPEFSELKSLSVLYISNNQLTSLPPEILELRNLIELDLSRNQLTSLPPEILELRNLIELNLSRNQLTSLPPEISELRNLTRLNIYGNQLTSLPPEISNLEKLAILEISENQLISFPPEILELKNLAILAISDNRVTSLPPEISKLKNLTELYIYRNHLTSLPVEITELKKLTQLNVSHNQLHSLPNEITELKNLAQLNIAGVKLSLLPSEFEYMKNLAQLNISGIKLGYLPSQVLRLKKLTQLDISGNKLTSLSPQIALLRDLSQLTVSNNQLTCLPSEITELKELTHLNISYNQLSSLSPEIAELKNLTQLNISSNMLTSLPFGIKELKNLTHLNISGNQLTSLPSEITELKKLTHLNISYNQLTSLPSEIYKLRNLTQLDIYRNELSSLPPEIAELKNLTQLNISSNRLTSLSFGIAKLKNLTRLDISRNQLTLLPPEILELDLEIEWNDYWKSNAIYLEGNPLENPPMEIVKQGREAVINYFKSGEKWPLNEVKVLLVGDGGAGKTSLVKRLVGEGFDENEYETHGINIKKWVVNEREKEIKANFWDFGGQEIMHATHQFFLSKRSLYILVLDGRKDEKPEYWLKLIENFGGDSPTLVVINKIDENPAIELNRKFLLGKYSSIKGFYRLSCKSNEGIEEFSKCLQKELTKVKHLEIRWPKSWFNVKIRLEKLCPNRHSNTMDEDSCKHFDFIEYEEYKRICNEEGIKNKSEMDTLVDFLHDIGVILHFKDIDLLNTHVLEPEWVTNAVYKIVNSKEIADSRGILKLDMLHEILKQTSERDIYCPPNQFDFFISLMKKFELAYELDNITVLLPSLLDIQEPDFGFDYKGTLRFIIDYDFLPPSVMPRFIVKMNKDIKDDLRWRTGVVLEDKKFNSSAVIRADIEAKRISIYINGNQRRDYFAVILQRFREINNSFEKLKAVEKIPLPDNPEITVSYDHLIKLELRGIETYMPDGSDNEYKVSDLLGTVINKHGERLLLEEIYRNTEMSKNREKEILEILLNLQKIDNGYDDEDTLIEKISSVVSVSFPPGVGVDISKIIKLYRGWKRQRT